jgi:hypothetical protein
MGDRFYDIDPHQLRPQPIYREAFSERAKLIWGPTVFSTTGDVPRIKFGINDMNNPINGLTIKIDRFYERYPGGLFALGLRAPSR